jgi:hypothetical protein
MASPIVRIGVYAPNGQVEHVFVRADDIRAWRGAIVERIEFPQQAETFNFTAPQEVTTLTIVHSPGQPPEVVTIAEPLHVFMGLMRAAGYSPT